MGRTAEKAAGYETEATMDSRDIDVFATILKERQDEILCAIETEAMLRDGKDSPSGMKRRLFLLLFGAAILIVATVTGIRLFI